MNHRHGTARCRRGPASARCGRGAKRAAQALAAGAAIAAGTQAYGERIRFDNPLGPGESDQEDHPYLFTNSDVGTKYLICKADYDNNVEEADENNNTWVYGPFTVQELGYLTVSIYPQDAVDDGG